MKVSAVDILANDAGYLGSYRPFEQFEPGEWQRIVSVNLLGMFEVKTVIQPSACPVVKTDVRRIDEVVSMPYLRGRISGPVSTRLKIGGTSGWPTTKASGADRTAD